MIPLKRPMYAGRISLPLVCGSFFCLSSCEIIGQYFERSRGNGCPAVTNEWGMMGEEERNAVKVRAIVTKVGPLSCEMGAERFAMDSDGKQPSLKYGVYMAQSYENEDEAKRIAESEEETKRIMERKRMAHYQESRGMFIPAYYKQGVTVRFTAEVNGHKEEKEISGVHTFSIGDRSARELHGGENGIALLDRETQDVLLRFDADRWQKPLFHKTTKNEQE